MHCKDLYILHGCVFFVTYTCCFCILVFFLHGTGINIIIISKNNNDILIIIYIVKILKTPNSDRYIVVNFCNTVPAGAKSFKKIT